MPSNFHAVKQAAEHAVLRRFGLQKTAGPFLTSAGRVLRSGAASGLVGGAIGGLKGFIEGGAPQEDGTPATLSDRLRSAGRSAAGTAAIASIAGGMAGGFGLNRQGLKNMFSSNQKPGKLNFIQEMAREGIFGSPVTTYERYRKNLTQPGGGHLKALGSELKNFYWPKPKSVGEGVWQAATLIPTAYDLYSAARTEDTDTRRGALASATAGILAAPVTSRLGLSGAMLHPLLQSAARGLVQKNAPAYTPTYDPVRHGLRTARGLKSYAYGLDIPGGDLEIPNLESD
jgi:hypothetical protein